MEIQLNGEINDTVVFINDTMADQNADVTANNNCCNCNSEEYSCVAILNHM